jgi:hypothetical protein
VLRYFLLVGSNLFFALPAVRAWRLRQFLRAFLYTAILLISGFYHLCRPGNAICLLPYPKHFFLDYLFSITVLLSNLLFLAPFAQFVRVRPRAAPCGGPRYEAELLPHNWHFLDTWGVLANALVVGLALCTLADVPRVGPPTAVLAALSAANLLVAAAAWLYVYARLGLRPAFDWVYIGVALLTAGGGIGLFLLDSGSRYWWMHSLWHVLGALGSFYLLAARGSVLRAAALLPVPARTASPCSAAAAHDLVCANTALVPVLACGDRQGGADASARTCAAGRPWRPPRALVLGRPPAGQTVRPPAGSSAHHF